MRIRLSLYAAMSLKVKSIKRFFEKIETEITECSSVFTVSERMSLRYCGYRETSLGIFGDRSK